MAGEAERLLFLISWPGRGQYQSLGLIIKQEEQILEGRGME